MKISEVMTSSVETVSADQTAREAANFMLRADAGSIPVCDGDKVIGMITDRDIAGHGTGQTLHRRGQPQELVHRLGDQLGVRRQQAALIGLPMQQLH